MMRLVALSLFASSIHSFVIDWHVDQHKRQDEEKFEWTAIGDSYASGVGSTDYVDGRRCLRYNESYGNMLNADEDLAPGEYIFNNVPCSGALASEIAEWQLLDEDHSTGPNFQYGPRPKFGNPKFASLTAGGDDIDFPGIIFNCIMDKHLWFGPPRRTCPEQREHSWNLLKSPDLVDGLDSLMQKTVEKGRSGDVGDDFRLFVTGYARFFSTETDECDEVTFARDANPDDDGEEHPRMTQEVRKDFNDMSDALNEAVKAAVDRNSDRGVVFVDIESIYKGEDYLKGHRYCEPGVKEPDPNNEELFFWHYPYKEVTDNREDPTIALLDDAYKSVVGDLGTEEINDRWPTQVEMDNAVYDAIDENKIKDRADASTAGWDFIGYRARVFHPQPRYHSFIRDRVLSAYRAESNTAPGGGCTSEDCCPSGCTCGSSGVPLCT